MRPFLQKSLKFVSLKLLFILTVSGLLGSCSWISNRKSLFGDNADKPTASTKKEEQIKKMKKNASVPKRPSSKNVSRAEYNELMRKYQALLDGQANPNFVREEKMRYVDTKDPADLVRKLKGMAGTKKADLAETVDIFGQNGIIEKKANSAPFQRTPFGMELHERDFVSDSIENEISKLRKAESFIAQNKFSEGLNLLKGVESSTSRQVRVRSKFLLGEILFKQKEYDLAMQVFEEILSKDAFSGMVLKSLGRLIVCCEKLKQEKKQQQYYSILHDFFEAEA